MKVGLASNPADKIIDYAYEYNDANGANNNRIRKLTGAIFQRCVMERSTLRCDCFRALMASGKMLSNQWRVIVTGKCGSLRVSALSLPSRANSMTLNP